MLELHLAEQKITGPSVKVGWCVSKDTLELLAARGIRDPALVLCVAAERENGPEYRKAVPLKDLIAYIDFHCVGKNNIFAFIASSKKYVQNKQCWTNHRGEYPYKLFTEDRTELCKPDDHNQLTDNLCSNNIGLSDLPQVVSDIVSVDVPEGVFAPEPSDLEKAWVNWAFYDRVPDQCSFRRRRLFAYTLQPIVFAFIMVIRLLLLLCGVLIVSRNIRSMFTEFFHPLNCRLGEYINMTAGNGSYCITGEPYMREWQDYAKVTLMPLVCGSFSVIVWLNFHYHTAREITSLIVCCAVVSVLVFFLVEVFGDKLSYKRSQTKPWYLADEELGLIVCGDRKKPFELSELPSKHRTLRLFYIETKNKICKPFSR